MAAQDTPPPPKQPQPTVKKEGTKTSQPLPSPKTPAGVTHPDQSTVPDQTQPDNPAPARAQAQSIPIVPPHFSDPLQPLWYGLIAISSFSILALAFTAWRLKTSLAPGPQLDSLADQVYAIKNQASRARSRYEELAARASRPPAPAPQDARVREQPPPMKEAQLPPMREPPEAKPPRTLGSQARVIVRSGAPKPNASPSAAAPRPVLPKDELVEAYHVARTSPDRAARDQFDSRYPYVRISCTNHEEWQFHKNITLRFEKEDFGWYLMVARGGKCYALPWFTQDLASERESFKGVFQYPETAVGANLRVTRAALLQSQGDSWILAAPGEVQADA
ncbi:MAG TPA: hypothetical protein VMH81_37745 [Bryobacteraceae bacterium]|nr:hypothetical protein [Bryobacteraceae bacterium]